MGGCLLNRVTFLNTSTFHSAVLYLSHCLSPLANLPYLLSPTLPFFLPSPHLELSTSNMKSCLRKRNKNKNSTSHSALAVSAWNCSEDNKDDQLNHTCKHNPYNPGSVWQDDQIRLQTEGSPRALNSAVDE